MRVADKTVEIFHKGRHVAPTLADAILDRLAHNAHRLQMTGESIRKLAAEKRVLDGVPKA